MQLLVLATVTLLAGPAGKAAGDRSHRPESVRMAAMTADDLRVIVLGDGLTSIDPKTGATTSLPRPAIDAGDWPHTLQTLPGGKIGVVTYRGTCLLLDAAGKELWRYKSASRATGHFLADGVRLAVREEGSYGSGTTVRLVDGATGAAIWESRPLAGSAAMASAPDGAWIAASFATHLVVLDGTTGAPLVGQETPAGRIAATRDGKTLATGAHDGSITLWDPANWGRTTFPAHFLPVTSLSFTNDGAWLVSTGEDGRVRVFDRATREQRWALVERADATLEGGFASADKSALFYRYASVLEQRSLTARDGAASVAAEPLHVSVGRYARIRDLRFTGDGSLAVAIEGSVSFRDPVTGAERRSAAFPWVTDDSGAAAVSPDGARIAVHSKQKKGISLVELAAATPVPVATSPTTASPAKAAKTPAPKATPAPPLLDAGADVRTIAWSPDGTKVAATVQSMGHHTSLAVWDVKTRKRIFDSGQTPTPHDLVWHRDGGSILVAGGDGRARVFDLAKQAVTRTLATAEPDIKTSHGSIANEIHGIAWLPNGEIVVAQERLTTVFDATGAGREIPHMLRDDGGTADIALLADGNRIAMAATWGVVMTQDLETGRVSRAKRDVGFRQLFRIVAGPGDRLATQQGDSVIALFDAPADAAPE